MGFNMTGAVAGLLGEYGNQANQMAARRQEIEQRKIEQAIEDRREQAKLIKEMGLAKYKADLDANVAKTKFGYDSDLKDKEIKAEYDLLSAKQKGEMSLAQYKASVEKSGGASLSADEKMLRMIENDPTLTAEERAAARKSLYGIGDKDKKGGLTDYQMMQAENKLAEIEGAGVEDDATAAQANAIRRRLGMPELKRVEKEPGRGGILGIGSKDPVYEYIEDYEGMETTEKAEGKPVENKPSEKKGGSLLDQVDKILPPSSAKAAAVQEAVSPEMKLVDKPASADLGSVLGTIVKGGVGAVQKLAAGGQDLVALDRQLTAEAKSAHGESKSAYLKAIAAVRQVMNAETNPEAELRARTIAPN